MDDKWEDAVNRFLGPPPDGLKPDAAALAALLLTDEPIPQDIRGVFAELIHPVLLPRLNWSLKWTGMTSRFMKKMARDRLIAAGKTKVGERHAARVRSAQKRGIADAMAWAKHVEAHAPPKRGRPREK